MRLSTIVSAFALSLFVSGAAFALDAAAPPPAGGAAPASGQSAKSLECSKEADAKGLHGKARKKFREECKKGK